MSRDRNLLYVKYRWEQVIILVTGYWLLVTLLGGCGYTTHSVLPSSFKTIYIPTFVNKIKFEGNLPEYKTYYPGLEIKITNAIINRFIYDGNLRIARDEEADLRLEGELVDYLKQPLRYSEANEIEEYRISLIVNLVLKDREGNLLWKESNFIGDTTYRLSGPFAKAEQRAVDDAVNDLARRVVNRTIENW
ncbi:MAG: LPS assembly lipoprotein LptE [Candidatus Omnitrophica bacterium]|nr:LPS assembly lipoprotein LptE [Candidatus Omnitrophota bacterium]MCM8793406.1 LPS assembly lipoprotein LptE [Candidatus Omnitrophota bacterium]